MPKLAPTPVPMPPAQQAPRSRAAAALAVLSLSALLAGPVAAGPIPLPSGGATFTGFQVVSGPGSGVSIDAGCTKVFNPIGSSSCNGQVFYANGPLGPGLHVTGSADGAGTVSGGSAGNAPVVTSHLVVSGGDDTSGAKGNRVNTVASYFVSMVQIATPPTPTTTVPLSFTDAGSVTGFTTSNERVGGEASTGLHSFSGTLRVDGGSSSAFFDGVVAFSFDGSMSKSYGKTHSVDFVLASDPVAEIDLLTECTFNSQDVGFGSGLCNATADPVVGFDQAAFDALMGVNTFHLEDFFRIDISPGFGAEPPSPSVPEPGMLALVVTGLAALRRRTYRREGPETPSVA